MIIKKVWDVDSQSHSFQHVVSMFADRLEHSANGVGGPGCARYGDLWSLHVWQWQECCWDVKVQLQSGWADLSRHHNSWRQCSSKGSCLYIGISMPIIFPTREEWGPSCEVWRGALPNSASTICVQTKRGQIKVIVHLRHMSKVNGFPLFAGGAACPLVHRCQATYNIHLGERRKPCPHPQKDLGDDPQAACWH